jgi:ComF family protein
MLWSVAGALFDFFMPAFCPLCGRPLQTGERLVCEACWTSLPAVPPDTCPRCGSAFRPTGGRCAVCAGARYSFESVRALGLYRGKLEELVRLMKYKPMPDLARRLGQELGQLLKTNDHFAGFHVVVPVPLHPTKRRERGFSQTAALAREVAHCLGVDVWEHALRLVRWTEPQAQLNWRERRENVRGAFAAGRGRRPHRMKVVLVDDVFTSGATADEASRTLLDLGARKVVVAAVARTPLEAPALLQDQAPGASSAGSGVAKSADRSRQPGQYRQGV